jgi:hypothetical protein
MQRHAVMTYISITVFLILLSMMKFQQILYYAQKPLYWTPLFLSFLLPYLKRKEWSALLFLVIFSEAMWNEFQNVRDIKQIYEAKGTINSEEEFIIRSAFANSTCREPFAYISETADEDFDKNIFVLANSMTPRVQFAGVITFDFSDLGGPKMLNPKVKVANDYLKNLPKTEIASMGPVHIACAKD